jgi:arginyl-tRNA synthetase
MNPNHALRSVLDPFLADSAPDAAERQRLLLMTRPAADARHGDYQANFAMPLAKALGRRPQELAAEIVAKIPADHPMIEAASVAGPGFINVKLRDGWIAEQVRLLGTDERLGVEKVASAKTFVIDYSGPNVAKPLHVGHLRSTIIGEALCRTLRFLGHTVIGDNHLGDWGTQFGILLYGYKNLLDAEAYAANPVRELARLYVEVRNLTRPSGLPAGDDEDEADARRLTPEQQAIVDAYRHETLKLHQGDPENRRLWAEFMPHCMKEIHDIYDRLDVHFTCELGESFFHEMLAGVVEDLLAKGVAEASPKGGVIVTGDKGVVSLIQKSDGAYTYTTTDLATVKYRAETQKADVMLYVVDFRQGDHFKNVFAAAKRWGYGAETTHVSFGSVLGPDRRPLRTRDGGVVELNDLLDEAIAEGGRRYVETRDARRAAGKAVEDLSPAEIANIAEVVGIGAVKYADLSQNRTSDYVYTLDKMLATEGNTATYLQYLYARCRAIFRKGDIDPARFRSAPPPVVFAEPEERAVALWLLRAPEALEAAASEYYPHLITQYLFDLAKAVSSFYASDRCKVLDAATPELRESRLLLCDLTARMMTLCLGLLGICVVEKM